jgi:hypothetical protein
MSSLDSGRHRTSGSGCPSSPSNYSTGIVMTLGAAMACTTSGPDCRRDLAYRQSAGVACGMQGANPLHSSRIAAGPQGCTPGFLSIERLKVARYLASAMTDHVCAAGLAGGTLVVSPRGAEYFRILDDSASSELIFASSDDKVLDVFELLF